MNVVMTELTIEGNLASLAVDIQALASFLLARAVAVSLAARGRLKDIRRGRHVDIVALIELVCVSASGMVSLAFGFICLPVGSYTLPCSNECRVCMSKGRNVSRCF
jgi:hypothetical protein